MPGIAGIIGSRHAGAAMQTVAAMLESMRHETYYRGGSVSVAECDTCFGWLAHPDSYALEQSGSGDQSVSLGLAGECFASLEDGASAAPAPDLMQRYLDSGESFVGQLNGLFAGVLCDARLRRVWLFNDRYGAEHIYYHVSDGVLYFASEAKALLTVLPKLRQYDEDGVAQFLAYGSTFDGKTLFRGVSRMAGGSLWTYERGAGLRRSRYFQPSEWEQQSELSENAM
jgi:asparagine synthase (glutamine-hydrolysing)